MLVVILDFDGTLVNTNEVKLRTFQLIFPELSNLRVSQLVQTTQGNRYDIIKSIDKTVRLEDRIYKYSDRVDLYDEVSGRAVNKTAEVYGATKFLQLASSKGLSLYISSATPDSVIYDLIDQRGWSRYFKGIYGSPETKISHINKIKKCIYGNGLEKHLKKRFIYIGDAKNDYEATINTNIEFFGIFIDGLVPEWEHEVNYSQNYINILTKLDLN